MSDKTLIFYFMSYNKSNMKYFNEKIRKFVEGCQNRAKELSKQTGSQPINLYSKRLFDLYSLEEGNVEPLKEDEINYLMVLSETTMHEYSINGLVNAGTARLTLENDFGWAKMSEKVYCEVQKEKQKVEVKKQPEEEKFTFIFDTAGLSTERFETTEELNLDNVMPEEGESDVH